jgi:hypothetical protein
MNISGSLTYHIKSGTSARVRKAGQGNWRPHSVTHDLTFAAVLPHDRQSPWRTFLRSGWELLVRAADVLTRIEHGESQMKGWTYQKGKGAGRRRAMRPPRKPGSQR